MTTLSLIAVGKMKSGPIAELAAEYKKRITWPLSLIEVEAKGNLTGAALKIKEAEALQAKIPAGAVIVALDERGNTMTSPDFSAWIGRQQNDGVANIAFVIGGADGLDKSLREAARLTLAFGAMTWPHMLVRVMMLEQLYRAQQILAGHPYHRV